jgi:hypothetical protein
MDIEGAEINVLSDSGNLCEVDRWIVETTVSDAPKLMRIMQERGYSGELVEHLVRGECYVNLFFCRNQH